MSDRSSNGLLKVGIIGTVIAALCCFTPILVITLGAVGLSALVGYLDYALLPALIFFFVLIIYALARREKGCCEENKPPVQGNLK